ncbi:hypothetical protein C8F04DRAFT_1174058 [Mycena alexandri]|uniref:Uncharacterized protein n=1 Tax=Mycena alexandri TaxID=1745969 RepID=A0AAD6XAC9_9AGAR|nr:hypothetical protein C8F04DRAFT_1174058 [Mycena alexandri]
MDMWRFGWCGWVVTRDSDSPKRGEEEDRFRGSEDSDRQTKKRLTCWPALVDRTGAWTPWISEQDNRAAACSSSSSESGIHNALSASPKVGNTQARIENFPSLDSRTIRESTEKYSRVEQFLGVGVVTTKTREPGELEQIAAAGATYIANCVRRGSWLGMAANDVVLRCESEVESTQGKPRQLRRHGIVYSSAGGQDPSLLRLRRATACDQALDRGGEKASRFQIHQVDD